MCIAVIFTDLFILFLHIHNFFISLFWVRDLGKQMLLIFYTSGTHKLLIRDTIIHWIRVIQITVDRPQSIACFVRYYSVTRSNRLNVHDCAYVWIRTDIQQYEIIWNSLWAAHYWTYISIIVMKSKTCVCVFLLHLVCLSWVNCRTRVWCLIGDKAKDSVSQFPKSGINKL